MKTLKTIYNFIVKSSANPKQKSLTLKFALLGFIPWAMQAIGLVCALGSVCLDIDQSLLERLVEAISELVYLTLIVIASVGGVWASIRKINRTIAGVNLALK